MATMTKLISDLTAATEQMRAAVMGEEWELAARIQKRRVALIRQLVELDRSSPLTQEELSGLKTVRRQEAGIAARVSSSRQTLGKTLGKIAEEGPPKSHYRLKKSYGPPSPRR